MNHIVRAIFSRALVLGAAAWFIMSGDSAILITGCLIALAMELGALLQGRRCITGGFTSILIAIFEMGLVAAITVLYFQSEWGFWLTLLSWITACWLLPIWTKVPRPTPCNDSNPPPGA